jgi:hypothetical protein
MTTATRSHKPAVLPIVLAAEIVGLKRNAAYVAAETGELIPGVPVIRVGSRKLVVPTSAIERVLNIDVLDHLSTADLQRLAPTPTTNA